MISGTPILSSVGRESPTESASILEETVLPEGRVGLGSLLTAIGRRVKLTDDELADFARRDKSPGWPIDFE